MVVWRWGLISLGEGKMMQIASGMFLMFPNVHTLCDPLLGWNKTVTASKRRQGRGQVSLLRPGYRESDHLADIVSPLSVDKTPPGF